MNPKFADPLANDLCSKNKVRINFALRELLFNKLIKNSLARKVSKPEKSKSEIEEYIKDIMQEGIVILYQRIFNSGIYLENNKIFTYKGGDVKALFTGICYRLILTPPRNWGRINWNIPVDPITQEYNLGLSDNFLFESEECKKILTDIIGKVATTNCKDHLLGYYDTFLPEEKQNPLGRQEAYDCRRMLRNFINNHPLINNTLQDCYDFKKLR